MFRQRRAPAPYFRVPTPFSPLTGEMAPLNSSGVISRVAMAQVISADIHENYLVCRLFDPECNRFLNSVNVAKPYSQRGTNTYAVGQVVAAMKPKTVLGETSGVAATTVGNPADLDEVVEILYDDAGKPVAWLALGEGGGGGVRFYEGTLPSALASTDASIGSATAVDVATGESLSSQTLYNDFKCAGASGKTFLAYKRESDGKLVIAVVENTSQAVLTDWRYNASTEDVEKKTRSLAGNWDGAESDWTKVDDTELCAGA